MPDLPTLAQLRRWRFRIFAITWLAYAGFYLCRRNLGVLMPLLQEHLDVSKLQLAHVVFGYSLSYALGQLFGGALSDRFSPRRMVTAGLAIAVLSNFAMGFSTSLLLLGVLSCLNGLGQSQGWPGLVKSMAYWFDPPQTGRRHGVVDNELRLGKFSGHGPCNVRGHPSHGADAVGLAAGFLGARHAACGRRDYLSHPDAHAARRRWVT